MPLRLHFASLALTTLVLARLSTACSSSTVTSDTALDESTKDAAAARDASPTEDSGSPVDACANDSCADSADARAACQGDAALPGAAYDITKSRFAFGGTPIMTTGGSLTHWTGPDGAIGIWMSGFEEGTLDGDAPESNLPPLQTTTSHLFRETEQYYESMGVQPCQVSPVPSLTYEGGGGGSADGGTFMTTGAVTAGLRRTFEDISIAESLAVATFDEKYQTTFETLYWPEIPKDVIALAVTFKKMLSSAAGLAAYRALLPASAQGAGAITIHHSPPTSLTKKFDCVVSYDAIVPGDTGENSPIESYDIHGHVIALPE